MKNSKLTLHILIWAALIMITAIIGGYSSFTTLCKLLTSIAVWVVYFYTMYLLVIPGLMWRRRIFLYALSTLVVSALTFVALKRINIYYTEILLTQQSEALDSYTDVKDSFDEKDRLMRRLRGERRGERRGDRRGEHRETVAMPQDSSKITELVSPVLTPREEEYGRLLQEYDRTRWLARSHFNMNYNPIEFFNLSYLYTIVFLFLASLASAYIKRSARAERRRTQLESEKTVAELAYLKQQINPHFLFNTLNSIYSYTLAVSEPASDAVLKLSSILRYMLYQTNQERVPLSDEIAILYDYIDLQKLRITEKTKVSVEINGDPAGHLIEPMLLIPILENAFKFGIDSFEPSFINIQLNVKGNDFVFFVENKIVRTSTSDTKSSGIGIKNIRRRLDLIYGENNYSLETRAELGVFYLSLHLNLKQ